MILLDIQPQRERAPWQEAGRYGGRLPLPVEAMDQVENHHVRGVDELALDRQKLALWRALWGRLVAHPVEETAVSDLAASWTCTLPRKS